MKAVRRTKKVPNPEKKGQVQLVDKIDIESAGAFDRRLDDKLLHYTGDDATDEEGQDGAFEGWFIAPEIIDHYDGRDGQEVQEMYADGKSHHKKDEDEPFV